MSQLTACIRCSRKLAHTQHWNKPLRCQPCKIKYHREKSRARYWANREAMLERNKAWRKTKAKTYFRELRKQYYYANREHVLDQASQKREKRRLFLQLHEATDKLNELPLSASTSLYMLRKGKVQWIAKSLLDNYRLTELEKEALESLPQSIRLKKKKKDGETAH